MTTLYEERLCMMVSQTKNIRDAKEKAEFVYNYEGVSAHDKVDYLMTLIFNDIIRDPYLDVCKRLIENHPEDFRNNGFKERNGHALSQERNVAQSSR